MLVILYILYYINKSFKLGSYRKVEEILIHHCDTHEKIRAQNCRGAFYYSLSQYIQNSRVLATSLRRLMVWTSFICHCLTCSLVCGMFHFTMLWNSFRARKQTSNYSLFSKYVIYHSILHYYIMHLRYNHGRNLGLFPRELLSNP